MSELFSYLRSIRYFDWQSVLDILLVAWLLYQCSLWVRGSRAAMAAVGLLVIGVVALLARWSGLILAGWLFQSLWAVIVILLIVVFQPELRQILERMSLLDVVRGRRNLLQRETLTELTEAVFDLARDKIGALVVLPQHDPLDPYLLGGVRVESLVSREVLRAVLQPPSPIHDGAIILHANRLERAACFLPMTTVSGLPSHYGARHRAALGLTERCDALCLLVSEEQGTVTLVRQGQFMPCPSPARLRQELAQALPALDGSTPPSGQRWYWLTNRLWAKVLAVGTAATLWMAVAGQKSAEIALTVPVEYQRIAPTVELRGDVPTEVLIRLRGPQLALDALRASPARVRVSLEQARDGLNYVVLTARHIDLPPGVELTDIRPSLLVLEVHRKSDAAPAPER
jgi:diadenylate cyclase